MTDAEYFGNATRLLFEAGATAVRARLDRYEGRRYYFLAWKRGVNTFDEGFGVEDNPKAGRKVEFMKRMALERIARMAAAKASE